MDFFKKYEYVYDEYYDCYICPNNKTLTYRTTNKDGYREYKKLRCGLRRMPVSFTVYSKQRSCKKTVTRHIWEPYMEICEDIRQMLGMKDLYAQRKRNHRENLLEQQRRIMVFRYTQMYGKSLDGNEGRAYICVYEFEKKLAKIKEKKGTVEGKKKTLRNLILYKN